MSRLACKPEVAGSKSVNFLLNTHVGTKHKVSPDIVIKRNPFSPKTDPNISHRSFYLKRDVFQNRPKCSQIFGLLL